MAVGFSWFFMVAETCRRYKLKVLQMIGRFNRSHRICLKKLVFSADIYNGWFAQIIHLCNFAEIALGQQCKVQ